jgi:prefoldin subunit 5
MCLKQYDSNAQQNLMLVVIVTDKILMNIGIIYNVKRTFDSNLEKSDKNIQLYQNALKISKLILIGQKRVVE